MMVDKGAATDMSAMTEEQVAEAMTAWGAWMQKTGPELVCVEWPGNRPCLSDGKGHHEIDAYGLLPVPIMD